jgi:hypothetical protein
MKVVYASPVLQEQAVKASPLSAVTVKHPGSPTPPTEVVGGLVVVGGTSEDITIGVSLLVMMVLVLVKSGILNDVSAGVELVVIICNEELVPEEEVLIDKEVVVVVLPKSASISDCAYSAAASSSLELSSVLLHCSHMTATIVEVGVLDVLVVWNAVRIDYAHVFVEWLLLRMLTRSRSVWWMMHLLSLRHRLGLPLDSHRCRL